MFYFQTANMYIPGVLLELFVICCFYTETLANSKYILIFVFQ